MATHVHDLKELPDEEARHLFPEKPQLHDLFVFFVCTICGEHLYMLKEDFEKRGAIDPTEITEHGAMFYFDKEAREWVLLYTIIR